MRDGGDRPVRRDAADAVVAGVGDQEPAGVSRQRRHGERQVQLGRQSGPTVAGEAGRARAGDGRDHSRRRDAPHAVIARVGKEDAPVGERGDASRRRDLRGDRRSAVSRETERARAGDRRDDAVRRTRLIRWLLVSASTMLPSGSSATPCTRLSCAAVAAPPSPENPAAPVPATVAMRPSLPTLRTAGRNGAANTKPPSGVTAMPRGWSIAALVAGPPSPSARRRRYRQPWRSSPVPVWSAPSRTGPARGRTRRPARTSKRSHRLRALSTRCDANRPMRRVSSTDRPAPATAARNSCSLRGGRSSGAGRPKGAIRLTALTAG